MKMRCAEVVGALSLSCDLGAGFPPESSLRIATIAARTAGLLGHDATTRGDAYFAGVLRLLGCTGFAHEQAQINGGDDIAFIRNYADIDLGRPREVLARTLRTLNGAAPLLVRVGSQLKFLSDPDFSARISAAHCSAAAMLAGKLGMTEGVRRALSQMYLRWDEADHLDPVTQVLHAAQVAEVHYRLGGPTGALAELRRRRSGQLSPDVVDAMAGAAGTVFASLDEPSMWDPYLDAESLPLRRVTASDRTDIATAFAHFADLKCPLFLGHSPAVAALARAAAVSLGVGADERDDLTLAGLLHDIGRLSVPNGLLSKTWPLNSAETDRIRSIPLETMRILRYSPLLAPLADLAGAAYEHLDGSGYPRGLPASALSPAARSLAAADAYVRARNHPAIAGLGLDGAGATTLADLARDGRLDIRVARAVLDAANEAASTLSRTLPDGLTEREAEVLLLLARGLTNPQIGETLGISPRTAQSHVASILGKTGVRARAAAALYAVEKNLV
jgi:HD-GYP domain-containing protein (c-di-GMP phosphodiesterase class II)